MSTHWRWVVMIIILILGLTGFTVGGVYLRRYIHRRRDAQESNLAGPRRDLETWGPGQSVHEFGPAGLPGAVAQHEKGGEMATVQDQGSNDDRRNSRRLKKYTM
ncbi:MAG: hypothetical protein Q9222_002014 [Ikaeria aurantiellina]